MHYFPVAMLPATNPKKTGNVKPKNPKKINKKNTTQNERLVVFQQLSINSTC